MKILEVNAEKFIVYGDALKISEKLKPLVYTVRFNKMEGFSLNLHTPLDVKEKLYGQYEPKVDKIVHSFDLSDRNIGVILSGAKGLGKSITARRICQKMNDHGYPVIMVDTYIPGIASYIASIQQECVVFFDEFEKTFKPMDDTNPQDELLSLFDGTNNDIKHLYIVTCNRINDLNDFILNRPGRFHYHIRWAYPTAQEIQEYLQDKVDPAYYGQISDVIEFSQRVPLNYDCLRAISFELNMGSKFKEAIQDMNILNTDNFDYNISLFTSDGTKLTRKYRFNMFDSDTISIGMRTPLGVYGGELTLTPTKAKYDASIGGYVLNAESVDWTLDCDYKQSNKEAMKIVKSVIIRPDLKGSSYSYEW